MKLLLPVDSRVADTQGFIILDTNTGALTDYETHEALRYSRRGFRGGCVVGRNIFVCNSYSVKHYEIAGTGVNDIVFSLVKQVHYPEWLIGRGANADLHMLHYEESVNRFYVANTYMDCIDTLTLNGELVGRRFLWEISDYIRDLVPTRNPKAADLCHVNHIVNISERILITLGNLNGTTMGAVLDYETGEIVIDNLHRPHDGVYIQDQFLITETSKKRVLVFDGIKSADDLKQRTPRAIELADQLATEGNEFWVRGILVTEKNIFIGCSQFQDRDNDNPQALYSHIVVVDRNTLAIVDRLWVPSVGRLKRPVLYSIFDLDSILST